MGVVKALNNERRKILSLKASFDSIDLASVGAAVGSAILTVYGFVGPYIYSLSIGSIVLTASLSVFIQRSFAKSARKYEKQRMMVTEALSPIHGELLSNSGTFGQNRKSRYANVPSLVHWQETRLTYRYYMIPESLRLRLDKLSEDTMTLDDLRPKYITEVGEIANKIVQGLTGRDDLNFDWPRLFVWSPKWGVISPNDDDIKRSLIFWKVGPATQYDGGYDHADVPLTSGGQTTTFRTLDGKETLMFAESLVEKVKAQPPDSAIGQAVALYSRIEAETMSLLEAVRAEILKWVE